MFQPILPACAAVLGQACRLTFPIYLFLGHGRPDCQPARHMLEVCAMIGHGLFDNGKVKRRKEVMKLHPFVRPGIGIIIASCPSPGLCAMLVVRYGLMPFDPLNFDQALREVGFCLPVYPPKKPGRRPRGVCRCCLPRADRIGIVSGDRDAQRVDKHLREAPYGRDFCRRARLRKLSPDRAGKGRFQFAI